MNSQSTTSKLWYLLLVLQLAGSVITLVMARTYLPASYLLGAAVVMILLLIGSFYLMMDGRSPLQKIFGRILSLLTILALIFCCVAIKDGTDTLNRIANNQGKEENPSAAPSSVETTEDYSELLKSTFVLYLSGTDERGKLPEKSKTDANVLAVVNPTTEQILLIGIPRDYYVLYPSSNGVKDKLTHSGFYGINESITAIQDATGIQIDYYARLNFSGIIDLIDALGGVDVNSPVAFTTLDRKYEIQQGMNHLNGDQALYFMRSRKMLKNGDNDRVSNQMRVIKAIVSKVSSFNSLANYSKILSVAEKNVQTSLSSEMIQALIRKQLAGANWDIQNYQLSGSDLYTTEAFRSPGIRTYVMIPDQDSIDKAVEYINRVKNNEKLDLEAEKKAAESSAEASRNAEESDSASATSVN